MGGVALTALALALAVGAAAGPARAATPPPSGALGAALKDVTSFHEDLARIDRARDLLEKEVAREPSLAALLLLAWTHLLWGDYRATDLGA